MSWKGWRKFHSCFDVMCSEYLRKSTIRLLILSKVHVNWTTFTDTFVYSYTVCLCTYGHPKGLSEGWGSPWKQIKEHVRGIRSRAHLQLKSPTTSTKWVHKLRTNFHMIAADYNIQFGFNDSWQPLCFFLFLFLFFLWRWNLPTRWTQSCFHPRWQHLSRVWIYPFKSKWDRHVQVMKWR